MSSWLFILINNRPTTDSKTRDQERTVKYFDKGPDGAESTQEIYIKNWLSVD